MSFNVIAYQKNHDPGGIYTPLTAVQDPSVRAVNEFVYINRYNQLFGLGVCTGAVNSGEPRLNSPIMRNVGYFDIPGLSGGIVGAGRMGFNDYVSNPYMLVENEGMSVEDNSDPGASEVHTVVAFLSDKELVPYRGKMHIVKASANIIGSIGSWVNGNIILSQALPAGNWSVVGASCVASGSVAFRLVFPESLGRPGGMTRQDMNDFDATPQITGLWGIWGVFNTVSPPTLDLLVSGACTTQLIYLYLSKV